VTAGTVTRDNQSSVVTDCGTGSTGLYFQKQWSGSDTPLDHHHENSYTCSVTARSNPLIQWGRDWYPLAFSGDYLKCFGGVAFQNPYDSNDELQLQNRLCANVRGHSFDAGVFLGEGKASLEMIGNSARDIARALTALRKGDLSALQKALRVRKRPSQSRVSSVDIQQRWLEYEFGWRPLVNDLHEGAQAVFALTNKPISRRYKASIKVPGLVTSMIGVDGHLVTLPGKALTIKQLRCYIQEDFSPWTSLGLTHPENVAWELLPYSFVVDWVIPIGTYLQVRSFFADLKGAQVYQTTYIHNEAKTLWVPPTYDIKADSNFYLKSLSLSRGTYSCVVPKPMVKDFSKIVSWRHAVDSVALLLNVFK